MDFTFLYEPKRKLFAIGYRVADAEGPGRFDPSYYDLLASEARLASFLAIAKGDVPEMHWFHLGRSITIVRGAPVLLSWSATLFEYLMPLLLMRSYPDTLLDESCRHGRSPPERLRRRSRRALGHFGVGVQPRRSTQQLPVQGVRDSRAGVETWLGRRGRRGALRHRVSPDDRPALRALRTCDGLPRWASRATTDSSTRSTSPIASPTHSCRPGTAAGVVVQTYLAHHEGHDPGRPGERAGRRSDGPALSRRSESPSDRTVVAGACATPVAVDRPAPARRNARDRAAPDDTGPPLSIRRTRSYPHTQFLSNGNYVTAVTNAGGGSSVWRGLAVTRWRRDATRDADGQFIYLRDVRSGTVWSATYQPSRREPDDYAVTFSGDRASFRRRDGDISTQA